MASIVMGSTIFGNAFGSDEMRRIFSDRATVRYYLEVEAALARAQAALGMIPEEAAQAIAAACDVDLIDMDRLREKTDVVGYPIFGLVQQIVERCADGHGQYCHWGATTQDIMDTADVLQIRDALGPIERDLRKLGDALHRLAAEHRDTVMAGRTHLQHAAPITFGYKCATWLSAVDRNLERLAELKPRVLVGELSGAAGTLASMGPDGLAAQDRLMDELGLGRPDITWHSIRDNLVEVSGFLAQVAGMLGKIALDVMLLMQTELGEVYEPFVKNRGASSTMPQKRNPISSELMLAAAKIVRQHHGTMLEALIHDQERATGPWHLEWHALPEMFVATAGALGQAVFALSDLEVNAANMRRNLDATGGLIVAEAVMMGLAPLLGRQNAHDAVYACCRESLETGRPFLDVLAAHAEIRGRVPMARLQELVDPANYVGSAPAMVDRLLAKRKARA